MKTDWKDAPDWAKYLAMDGNHEWFWYENEPSKEDGWWDGSGSRYARVSHKEIDWERSLKKRPEKKDD